jgi:hypothetical protein
LYADSDGARTPSPSNLPTGLVRLINANAPYWAAEAEVCRTYFNSPLRTAQSDCAWLARQAAKELVDGVIERADELHALLTSGEIADDFERLAHLTEEIHEEANHYAAFAAAHELIRTDGIAALDGRTLLNQKPWPENIALTELRDTHRRLHGELGARARLVTEGGYCTLFTEGMRLAGRSGADDAIAHACSLVYEDEFEHMLTGIIGLGNGELRDEDWDLLIELTVAQSRLRIRMRQQQFDHPVDSARLEILLAGGARPLRFDWAKAGLARAAA